MDSKKHQNKTNMKNVISVLIMLFSVTISYSQLSITNNNTNYTIDFESTVNGVNNSSFLGSGFSSSPSSGQLDTDAWATTGFSDGAKDFGVNNTSGDHARGTSNGGVATGGIYGFDVGGGDIALGIQGTGGDWTPGTISLKMLNNSSSTISDMTIDYNIYVRNDQSRSNSFNLSISYNNTTYSSITSSNYTSPQASSGTNWIVVPRTIVLSNMGIAPGDDFYIRWSGSDVSGSGSRDEFALNDLVIGVSGATSGCIEPTAQASNLNFGTVTDNSIQASFSASAADKFLIVESTSSSLGAIPTDGVQYNVGSAFGSGEVIQYSNSSNINSLGLSANTTYYYSIFAANDNCSGGPDYLTSNPLTGSTSTTGGGSDYYSSIGNETCASLKTALYNLINNHTVVSYASLWTHYQTTDDHLNDSGTEVILWDMYSDNPGGSENEFTFVTEQCGTYQTEGDCYNREHSFPKSWWGGSTSVPQYTDLFTVVPADGWINGVRNNNPYGEIQSGTETHITNNGSALGSSSITVPGYSGSVFEPIDAYKGDLARGYFYMSTRYENGIASWENSTVESDAVLDGTAYPAFEQWTIDMLLAWHSLDPVDTKEIERNETIFGIQGNRNPFIDHPEYVDLIWSSCGGSGGDTEAPTAPTNLLSSNTTETTTDLTWTVSTDNVGVTGYDIYQDGSYITSTATSSLNINSLTAATTYDFYVEAYDAAGNVSPSSNVVSVTTDSPPSNNEILASYFETGWDGWSDGGSDCARYSGGYSPEGLYSIQIRDNSGTASSMTSPSMDLTGYTSVDLEFSFEARSMENNEDFWLRYFDGNSWQTVETYVRGTDFQNGVVYSVNLTLQSSNYNFSTNSRIRFQCDASGNNDKIYIDAVVLTGNTNSGFIVTEENVNNLESEKMDNGELEISLDNAEDRSSFSRLHIYPNPTSDYLIMELDGKILEALEISIYDALGKKVDQFPILPSQDRVERNLTQLSDGMYILKYNTKFNAIRTEKIYLIR